MADIGLSFNAEGGVSLDDLVGIFAGTINPAIIGEAAPIGSLFIKSSGLLYQKIGALDTDWRGFSFGRRCGPCWVSKGAQCILAEWKYPR